MGTARAALRWLGRQPGRVWALALAAALLWLGPLGFRAADAVRVNAAVPALQGQVVVIDPGHGGADGGASGAGGTLEKDVVLAVSLRLRDRLLAAGARPVLTRDTDRDPLREVPEGTRRDGLLARAKLAAASGAAVFVSIHANKLGRQTPWKGAQVFYDPDGDPRGQELARLLQEELRNHTATRRVHLPIGQLVLEQAAVPAATVEVGFLSNPQEERLLRDPAYQDRLAEAILAGIARFLSGTQERGAIGAGQGMAD